MTGCKTNKPELHHISAREDELEFVTMVVRFRPPSARAKVELTPQPAEP